ncbi:hypothetical protein AB434_0767 [Heyndrickxia coagulans]|nr:hypothetical protein AB434_0767 [Heyndrickxia coagulans]KYC64339.1 hypothetical protein B4100_1750 [Heyndrickxia coagulans]
MPGQKRTADKSSAVFSYLYIKHTLLLLPDYSLFYSKSLLYEEYKKATKINEIFFGK